jgi:SAM-dependent methyltransferase
MADQSQIFREGEGDAWFRRNSAAIDDADGDQPLAMIARYREKFGPIITACELGCANGYRLARLAESYPDMTRLAGCDVSSAAILDGRERWPALELKVGSIEDPGIAGQFDIVIVSFVLCWIDREKLLSVSSSIDALVRPGGALIISDFLPFSPMTNRYHHRDDVEVYTYKQDYSKLFTSLGYAQIDASVFAHDGSSGVPAENNRACCFLLRKGGITA